MATKDFRSYDDRNMGGRALAFLELNRFDVIRRPGVAKPIVNSSAPYVGSNARYGRKAGKKVFQTGPNQTSYAGASKLDEFGEVRTLYTKRIAAVEKRKTGSYTDRADWKEKGKHLKGGHAKVHDKVMRQHAFNVAHMQRRIQDYDNGKEDRCVNDAGCVSAGGPVLTRAYPPPPRPLSGTRATSRIPTSQP
jgi:hypothetical protein